MNKYPRTVEVTVGNRRRRSERGQSDVLALVILFGMIFVGAAAVLITGGYLVDDVQGESQHELAKDSAVQTHESISEALRSGDPTTLGVSDSVDMQVLESGSIAIAMTNSSGGICAADGDVDVAPVETDLGAIVYDTPKGQIVYQGGAIWEKTEAGLSTVRAPPISYDNETARISIQTVSADADSLEGQMARPNETMQTAMAEETNRLLTRCPASGYTGLEITLTSPNYAERWESHFEQRVNASSNVNVTRSGDTVVAEISNATSAHASRGLRFEEIYAPDPPVVGDGSNGYASEFELTAAIANDGFAPRNATVKLEINGTPSSSTTTVPATGTENVTVPPGALTWNDLKSNYGLATGETHEYTLTLRNADAGEVVSTTSGRFYLAESGGGDVSFFDDSHRLEDSEDTLVVNATLINTDTTNKNETVEFQITDEDVNMSTPITADLDVPPYGGTTGVAYEINVSALGTGTYDYVLRHDNETRNRTFEISTPPPGSGADIGDLRVESFDPSAGYVTNGSDFDVEVQLFNTAQNETSAHVSLAVPSEAGLTNATTVTIDGTDRETVTVTLDASALSHLDTRTPYDYDVTVTDTDGGQLDSFPGRFVFMEPGRSLQIDENSTTRIGDTRWINVTLANHGVTAGDDDVTLDLYDNDSGTLVGDETIDDVHLDPTNRTTIPFNLNGSKLGGTYRYEVSYGTDTAVGRFSEGDPETGGGNVSITQPGNGSVTVLGTEVSAYDSGGATNQDVYLTDGEIARDESDVNWQYVWGSAYVDWEDSEVVWENATLENPEGEIVAAPADLVWDGDDLTLRNGTVVWQAGAYGSPSVINDDDENLQGDDVAFEGGSLEWGDNRWTYHDEARKYWSPVSVGMVLETDGNETVHQFENDAADEDHIFNDSNLNSFDTQEETYTHGWTQVRGETTNLTVQSTLWEQYVSWDNQVNTRPGNGPQPPVEDYHPEDANVWDSNDTYINAHAGSNKEAVRVLEDGDPVPNPETSGEDQRSAKEILEANGVGIEDGNLSMGPYEAIFLFELTAEPGNYADMWNASYGTDGDPDYNDVIALMRFNPDDPEDVSLHVGEHGVRIGPAPEDPQSGNDTPGNQSVAVDTPTERPGSGGTPSAPTPQTPDPGAPSEPDQIDVDVGGVVIG